MLTKLEISTLQKIANGKLTKQIAFDESSSLSAINKRLCSAKRKLKAKTLPEAIYKACKQGLICLLIVTTQSLEFDMIIHPDDHSGDMQRRVSRKVRSRSRRRTDVI